MARKASGASDNPAPKNRRIKKAEETRPVRKAPLGESLKAFTRRVTSRLRPATRRIVPARRIAKPASAQMPPSAARARAEKSVPEAPMHVRRIEAQAQAIQTQSRFEPPRMPVGPPRPAEEQFAIPAGYGDHRIVLMVKDPWWLHTYWEIQSSIERQVRSQLKPDEMSGLRSVLRVYDVTGINFPKQQPHAWFDIILSGLASNWYVHVNAPNRSFIVDIGLLTRTGRFLTLARSNQVTTPRFGPSDVIDEEWMSTDDDYWKMFGLTAGIGMGSSMSALRQLLERQLLASPGLFSPGLFSPVKIPKARGFWFWVDCELIVYGATDPKATVTIQGQPIQLRPDGTFSVRMALPDGTQTIPCQATSPDRVETRTITPVVNRRTEGHTSQAKEQTEPAKARV